MKEIKLQNGEEIYIRLCDGNDIDAILTLQNEVIQSLDQKAFLEPLSKSEYVEILAQGDFIIGAFQQGQLIAFRALLVPDENEDEHLADDIQLRKEDWRKVIYSEISNVSPLFRGNRLQQILGHALFETIDTSKYRYICATVAPFNIASLKDKFALGLQIGALTEKYNGKLRYIFVKDLFEQRTQISDSKKVKMKDTKHQQELLKSGYKGIDMQQENDEWYVHFVKNH